MSSRGVLNLVLAAVVAALTWLALRPAPDGVPEEARPVSELDPGAIARVRIERPEHAPVDLRREGAGWSLVEPLQAPADAFRVQALLGLLAGPRGPGFPARGSALSEYGLEPPRARLRFDGLTLAVGDAEPISGRRYLLDRAGDRIHLVEDPWFAQVFGSAAAWVDPRPLPGDAIPVAIALPDATWRLEDGRWRREPPDPALSADAGVALADAWRRARALAVRDLDPEAAWDGEVRIHLDGNRGPIRLKVARGPGTLLLGDSALGVQYRFLARQGANLLATAPP